MANTYKSDAKKITTATLDELFECPADSSALFRTIKVCNIHATNAFTIDVAIRKAGAGSDVYLVKGVSIAAGAQFQVVDEPIPLEEGDKLKTQASAANGLDIVWGWMEIS